MFLRLLTAFLTVSPLAPAPAATAAVAAAPAAIAWGTCSEPLLASLGLECAKADVPLDHAAPGGRTVKIALARKAATAPPERRLGALLVNVGGPGQAGRTLAAALTVLMPSDLVTRYDIIGYDPRGTGASEPRMSCDPARFAPVQPDTVPRTLADERAQIEVARGYAAACAARHGDLLPHMRTADNADDLDALRRALGQDRISYLGYGYGSYLGAVYATRHPGTVARMVLDSVVRPSHVWYRHGLDHATAMNDRARDFFAWIARHKSAYALGDTPEKVERAYYAARDQVRARPAGQVVGPREFDGTYLAAGYETTWWPMLAAALSALARGDAQPLVDAYRYLAPPDDNDYAVHSATQCADAPWPRDWDRWRRDAWRLHLRSPFVGWTHVWYNAPCAFWPVPAGPAEPISGRAVENALLVQATKDAGAPWPGALELHAKLPTSRLVLERGGMSHGVSFLRGNACVDGYVAAYLADGTLPDDRPGADAACDAPPEPVPAAASNAATADAGTAAKGAAPVVGAPVSLLMLGRTR
ncbi:alpha/beta hydrolase [Nonomuraea sp. NPDC050786]|uniref:alpha/beta hydrolase n=1 Tax=Nonomuraea sp. NPDC050786 TaxID=3154840 RepID=UPI0034075BAF